MSKQFGLPGVIVKGAVYTLDEIRNRFKWSDSAFREARRKGLKVYRVGRRAYISGDELIRFITSDKGGDES